MPGADERPDLRDSLILTVMLYFTGGTHNPFAGFYLLLVALAAMTLSGRALCLFLALVLAGGGRAQPLPHPIQGPDWVVGDGRLTYQVFLAGWGVAWRIIASCIAFFVHRMNRQLREREQALAEAERQVTEANRFQALATLAAGVAHELGSPLGTIAIASKDLERSLHKNGAAPEWREDAGLIRSEVERCRQILDRLDRRSTRRTGESPEPCTAALLCQRLEKHLASQRISSGLKIDDRTADFPLVLSTGPCFRRSSCLSRTPVRRILPASRWCWTSASRRTATLSSACSTPARASRKLCGSRIGEPFFTTKSDQSGMGLGIFLVQTLTGHLGGSCSLAARHERRHLRRSPCL